VSGEPSLHPLLTRRWSPLAFDTAHEISPAEVDLLLEAARWAPSAGNSQPWAFLVARRGQDVHRRLVAHLAPSAARWAPSASLLVVNLCHRYVEGTDWEFSEFALYDLGQAVAHMTLQAQALGLYVRQFRAFDQAGIAAEFAVPEHWQVTSMSAFGALPAAAEPPGPVTMPRSRRPVAEITWPAAGA
jgi:nitroreductase